MRTAASSDDPAWQKKTKHFMLETSQLLQGRIKTGEKPDQPYCLQLSCRGFTTGEKMLDYY